MMREFEIERQFNIKIEVIKANKGIYYLKTNKGERCLKKMQYNPNLLFGRDPDVFATILYIVLPLTYTVLKLNAFHSL